MKVLLQLVKSASVRIKGQEVASIDKGFLLFLGLTQGDDEALAGKMAEKISKLRIFPDENGKTNLSIKDVGGNVLCVSQFTLYGDAKKGNRPSFVNALSPDLAKPLYEYFLTELSKYFPSLEHGTFQADMEVALVNDGPFTLMLDSKELFA